MVMQASGAIKFSEMQTEHGGTNPIAMTEYYGADVVYIPQSGIIAASDFYNSLPELINPSGATDTVTATDAGDRPLVTVTYQPGGNYTKTNESADQWLDTAPSGRGSLYEIKWTQISGDTLTTKPAADGTWINISVNRIYGFPFLSGSGPDRSATIDITVRAINKSDTEVVQRFIIVSDHDPV